MPANNKKSKRMQAQSVRVGQTPEPVTAPQVVFRKTLQDALVDGLESPSSFCRDFLDIDPYEAQCHFIDETRDCSEANFVAGNRVGKSWLGGAMLVWRAFYRYISPFTAPQYVSPHNVYKAVSVSLTHDQAKLTWNYALTFMTQSKRFKPFLRDFVYSPYPTIYLQTKNDKGEWVPSEIWARSLAKGGVHLLGHSINFVLVDECAYIKNYTVIEDEVIRMRLADTGGSIFRISTPNGRNHFYTYYLQGLPPKDRPRDPRYYSYRITTWDNPYVSREYLLQQQERMIKEYYEQNIMGEFVSLSDFFKIDQIQNLYDGVEHALNEDPERNHAYVLGVDLGALRDPTVCYVLDITNEREPAKLVGLYEVKDGSWASARALANMVYHKYWPVYTTVDATGVGRPVYQQFITEDGWENAEEFIFGAQSKPDLMTRLQDRVQRGGIKFPYCPQTQDLIAQMSFYRLDDKALTQDHVIALALANWSLEQVRTQHTMETEVFDDLNFISVRSGGLGVPRDLIGDGIEGPGFLFSLDPETGLFVPNGYGLL